MMSSRRIFLVACFAVVMMALLVQAIETAEDSSAKDPAMELPTLNRDLTPITDGIYHCFMFYSTCRIFY